MLRDLAEVVLTKRAQEHKLQGETEVQGIPVAIENRKGSVREGTTEDGHHWRTKMRAPYGYIKGTKGADGEEIDAYVGPDKDAPNAYVVHQHKPDGTGFDEDKVMLGFKSEEEAKKTYLQHYDDPKFLGPISTVPVEKLKEKVEAGGVLRKIAEAVLPAAHSYREVGGNCGPASLRIALRQLGKDVAEKTLAERGGGNPEDGTSPEGLARAARDSGARAKIVENMSIGQLKKLTDAGTPVIVDYQDGPADSYNNGHYSVASKVGKTVTLSDPSSKNPLREVPVGNFVDRWHDEEPNGRRYEQTGIVTKLASEALLMRQLRGAAQEAELQIEKLGHVDGGLVVLVYDPGITKTAEDAAPEEEVDPRYHKLVQRRFQRFGKALGQYGNLLGTGHKRILIPKTMLNEQDLTKHLGFVPVKVAIPEAGQTRFESFRNPYNLYHLHEHGNAWVMHEDEHPASTMLMKKWMMERAQHAKERATGAAKAVGGAVGKAKERGSSLLKPVTDFVRGLPHVVTEGLPGAYYYLKGRLSSAPGMRERLEQATPKEYMRKLKRWKPFHEEEAAPAAAPVEEALPKAASADLMRKLADVALTGKGEFAPGIPASRKVQPLPRVKSDKPQTWQMALQQHEAERAGAHADLRLVDNQGRAHSWAIPKGKLPAPGEKLRVIPQPTHTPEYAARKGEFEIPEGYGKGKVRSEGLRPVEVVKVQPGRIVRFNVYGGQKEGNQEFALVQTPRGQLLHNITATAETGVRGPGGHPIPQSKPKYKEVSTDRVRFDDADEIHQAKVDGAHVTFHLRDGKGVKVFSYRPTERATGVLEHTHKLPEYRALRAPPGLAGTVLRGELYAANKESGKALPAEQVGGLLNATVWRSREKQKELGAELKPVIFDVVRYKGRDVSNAPYSEKLQILKEVEQKIPRLKLPPTATTPQEKEDLFRRIREGQEPITGEGIVAWKLPYPHPTKAKFKPDVDAEVVGVTPGKGKHEKRIGALVVRLPGRDATTHVGTGLSDELRDQIAKNPEEYIGRVAKVRTMQVFPSGRLRAPAFAGFHLEKGKQPMEEK